MLLIKTTKQKEKEKQEQDSINNVQKYFKSATIKL